MALPLVSLCMSSFNNARYVVATLESLRNQNYPNLELIIVDDYSTDNSVAVINEWLATCTLPHRFILHERNLGVCRVANSLVDHAHGQYVSIIASDDIMLPHKISSQVALFEAAPANVALVYSDVVKIDSAGALIATSIYEPGSPTPLSGSVWLELLRMNFIPAMAVMLRRECLAEIGPFDESLAFEDWDMWLRLARKYEVIYQPEPTVQYRIHSSSFVHKRQVQLLESTALLLSKQLGVSSEGDAVIQRQVHDIAEKLYHLGSVSAHHWLRLRYQFKKDKASLVLLMAATLKLPPRYVARSQSLLNKLRRSRA